MTKQTEENTETTAPEKSKLDLVKEAQAEQQTVITAKRLELIDTMMEHKSIGGEDQTQESLMELLGKYPLGIPYPYLQSTFVEAALTAARDALVEAKKIEKIGKKGHYTLKLATAK